MVDFLYDAMASGAMLEVCEDGAVVGIALTSRDGTNVYISLSADDAFALAETIQAYAAGL